MANYVKATNFTAKDGLPSGDPGKIIKGAEIDTELTAVASAISSKSDSNSPSFTGTPTAPTAAFGTNTTQLATTAFVIANAIPVGLIAMWSGSIASIPSGWALCDGSSGRPDLRNRFIVGAGSTYAVGATGGATTSIPTGTVSGSTDGTAISEAQMPKHFHRTWGPPPVYTGGGVPGVDSPGTSYPGRGVFNGGTPDDGATDYGTWSVGGGAASGSTERGTGAASPHSHSVSGLSLNGSAMSIVPPYYALAFIIKI